MTRRTFSASLVTLTAGLGLPGRTRLAAFQGAGEISRAAEAIHQDVLFNAARQRVYDALTDAAQFTTVTSLGPVTGAAPAEIGRRAGDAFALFAGHITGRHIELVSPDRVVQAWRAADWEAGLYSIARFELKSQGAETRLVFDHTGFPAGAAQHLADGWRANYWEPMKKFLAS